MRRASPPYSYADGPADGIGVGVMDMALVGVATPLAPSYLDSRYGVLGSINPVRESASAPMQQVPMDDLIANGHFLAGTLALAELSEQKG